MAVNLRDLDFVDEDVDLRLVEGSRVSIGLIIVDNDGAAVNVTGRTYLCTIYNSVGSNEVFTVVPNNAVQGLVDLELTSSLPNGRYTWDAWEDGSSFLWKGSVEIVAKYS